MHDNTETQLALFGGEQTPEKPRTTIAHPFNSKQPMHAVLAFSSVPLFLGALLSDWAYSSSHQIQWVNFAAWLIAGGLLISGSALLWGAVDVLRSAAKRHRRGLVYLTLLLATFVGGFTNALIHAKDGWAAMPSGLILSVLVTVLAATASLVGLAAYFRRTT